MGPTPKKISCAENFREVLIEVRWWFCIGGFF